MKKILFTLIATIIISSCTTGNDNDEATFIVKFKDGTEVKVVGTNISDSRNCIYLYDNDKQVSVLNQYEVLYILKEQQ